MLVQFAAFLTEDLSQENNVKRFKPSEKRPEGSVLTTITVAEAGKEKKYHTVKFWGREGLHEFLVKGKCIQVSGDMGYDLVNGDEQSRKYYAVENANIDLLGGPSQKEAKKSSKK